jgi:uncharacterized membrane protein YeaQ/YmgE (transglycosylase-associated protein family)
MDGGLLRARGPAVSALIFADEFRVPPYGRGQGDTVSNGHSYVTNESRGGIPLMEISGVISAIVIGIVIGVLGRLVIPGRQRIGILWTIAIGIVAAFIGTGIASGLDVADSKGVDWVEWLIQIALAALGVAAVSKVKLRH